MCQTRRESLAEYLADRAYVSSSQLRRFARSGKLPRDTAASGVFNGSLMGEALHSLILEPEVFEAQYLVLDSSAPSKKKCLSESDAMQKVWLDPWQWSALAKAREAILNCTQAPLGDWLSRGRTELSIYWSDESGRRWKARPDCFTDDVVLDLKTTLDCRPGPFARTRERMWYDLQAAHYVDAVGRLTANRCRFAYVAVETSPPYALWVHELSAAEILRATAQLEHLKTAFAAAAAPPD